MPATTRLSTDYDMVFLAGLPDNAVLTENVANALMSDETGFTAGALIENATRAQTWHEYYRGG